MTAIAIARLSDPSRPVAYVVPSAGTIRCAIVGPDSSTLRVLLAHAATASPSRILRSRDRGRVRVVAERIPPDNAAWFPVYADLLTFHRRANREFTASVVDAIPAGLQLRDAPAAHLAGDALSSTRAPPIRVPCPCGGTYPFLSAACNRCRGTDPLSAVVGTDIQALADRFLPAMPALTAAGELGACTALRGPFARHLDRLKAAATSTEHLDEKPRAAATLDDLRARVEIQGLSKDGVSQLVGSVKRDTDALLWWAESYARTERQHWMPGAAFGWIPTDAARRRLGAEIGRRARPTIDAARAVGAAQVAAAGRLARASRIFQRILDKTWYGDLFRTTLTVVSAIKTLGVSLLLKGAMWAVREERDAQTLAQFDEALGHFGDSLGKAVAALDFATRQERVSASARRAALSTFLVTALAHDYASASPAEQHAIARRVAIRFGDRPPRRDRRGRRRAPTALFVAMIALALAIAAALVLVRMLAP